MYERDSNFGCAPYDGGRILLLFCMVPWTPTTKRASEWLSMRPGGKRTVLSAGWNEPYRGGARGKGSYKHRGRSEYMYEEVGSFVCCMSGTVMVHCVACTCSLLVISPMHCWIWRIWRLSWIRRSLQFAAIAVEHRIGCRRVFCCRVAKNCYGEGKPSWHGSKLTRCRQPRSSSHRLNQKT